MECISCRSFDPVLSHLYVSKAASFLDLPNKEKAMAYKAVFLLTISENSVVPCMGLHMQWVYAMIRI